MDVIPEKQWAVGLSKEEFAIQFSQKYPHAIGIVPDQKEWLGVDPLKYNGIDSFNAEQMIEGEEGKDSKPAESRSDPKVYRCQGCDRTFTHNIGKVAHERKCKALEAMK